MSTIRKKRIAVFTNNSRSLEDPRRDDDEPHLIALQAAKGTLPI
jgi:hypothetical protein